MICVKVEARSENRHFTLDRTNGGFTMTSSDRKSGVNGAHVARSLVSKLTEEIRAADWVEGTNLGSEADLLRRFGVGRNVLREAARVLEQQGIAKMRMGRGGGLVVSSPEATTTAHALEMYLASRKVSGEHVLEAKREVELTCVRLAARRANASWAHRLRTAVAEERSKSTSQARAIDAHNVHIVIAEMTGNPALALFIDALTHLSANYVSQPAAEHGASATYEAHARIADAVARGDEEAAVREMAAHLDEVDAAILGSGIE